MPNGTTALFALCALFLLAACGGESSPAGIDPPGGGAVYELDPVLFASAVAPVLSAEGCDAAGDCHGGGIRGTFELSPGVNKDVDFDFGQSVLQVDGYDPTNSPLLTEPLDVAAGGSSHGFTAFDSTDDPGYLAILDWILRGEFR
jgi:hypothetical protein